MTSARLVEMKGIVMVEVDLEALNGCDAATFEAGLGDIVEASPWVARAVAAERPFASVDALIDAFQAVLARADDATLRTILCAHPDLGAKVEALSEASAGEQRGAGLAGLAAPDGERLRELNEAYRTKFGFPLVFAVKGAAFGDILAAFEARLPNDGAAELAAAREQVARIVANRLRARIR